MTHSGSFVLASEIRNAHCADEIEVGFLVPLQFQIPQAPSIRERVVMFSRPANAFCRRIREVDLLTLNSFLNVLC